MLMERYLRDAGIVGWITTAEAFLCCVLVVLAPAGVASVALTRSKKENARLLEEKEKLKNENLALNDKTEDQEKRIDRLKTDLDRAEQALADKGAIARLLAECQKKIRDLEMSQKAEIERFEKQIAALEKLRDELRMICTKQREKLDLLAAADAKAKRLLEELEKYNALKKEHADLQNDIATLTKQLKELQAQLASKDLAMRAAEKEREDAEREIQSWKNKAMYAQREADEIKQQIFKPLDTARLAVTIGCEDLPDQYDLDLYVQDPKDELCYWKNPRIFSKIRETGILVPSEDFSRMKRTTEEAFYSNRLVETDSDHPYLVYCMVRNRRLEDTTKKPFNVQCTVSFINDQGRKISESCQRVVKSGWITVDEKGENLEELTPVWGFRVANPANLSVSTIALKEVRAAPRGWQIVKSKGDRFQRIRD